MECAGRREADLEPPGLCLPKSYTDLHSFGVTAYVHSNPEVGLSLFGCTIVHSTRWCKLYVISECKFQIRLKLTEAYVGSSSIRIGDLRLNLTSVRF